MTHTPEHTPEVAVDDVEPPTIGSLQLHIAALLDDIPADAARVAALVGTRPQARMTVVSPTTLAASGQNYRRDRAAALSARRSKHEQLGQAWTRAEPRPLRGATKTPINISAASMSDAITRALHASTVDLIDYDQVPNVLQLKGLGYVVYAVARIRDLVWTAGERERAALERIQERLDNLFDLTRRFLDLLDQRTRLTAPCPHCGHRTLVVIWDERLIRCDRAPDHEHYQPCVCRDAICECKNRPVGFRHTWIKTHPDHQATSWEGLNRSLERAATTPPKESPR